MSIQTLIDNLDTVTTLNQVKSLIESIEDSWVFHMQTSGSSWVILSNDSDSRYYIDIIADNSGRSLNSITIYDRGTGRERKTAQRISSRGFPVLLEYMHSKKLNHWSDQ